MKAGRHDFTLTIGSTFGPITFTGKDANGDPADLTGYTAYAEVRTSSGSTVIIDLSPEITDELGGEITIPAITDEATAGLTAGKYQWDMLLEDSSGAVKTPILEGRFTIKNKITNS